MKGYWLLVVSLLLGGPAHSQENMWREVEDTFRTTGRMLDSSTIGISIPRVDQTVTKGEVKLTPEFGLTNEIKFTGRPEKAMVMAELVLMEREVQPVITLLQAQGVEITALHNHLLGTDPPMVCLHVHGSGAARGLAIALKSALDETGAHPVAPDEAAPAAGPAQWAPLQSILGHKGVQKGSVLTVEVPRKERVTDRGAALPPPFAAVHRLLFQKSGEKVAVTGELALLDREVNQVAKMLKENRFDITALHNHHLFEHPRLFYLHFWGSDPPETVAKTLRRALEMAGAPFGASPGSATEGTGSGAGGRLPAPPGNAPAPGPSPPPEPLR